MEGLIMGLANGTACLASCAPVILPYLMGESKSVKNNTLDLFLFLLGRLIGYSCFGILAWAANEVLIKNLSMRSELLCGSYIILSVLLIHYNLSKRKRACNLKNTSKALEGYIEKSFILYPALLGLITGINICPPFLLVFTEAVGSGSMKESVFFFIMFFLGTSIYFIPFPFIGLLKKLPELKTVGELAVYLMAGFYLIKGIIIFGGLIL